MGPWAVVLVVWLAYSSFTPMIRVRILLKSSYSFEKNENDKGEAVVGIFVQSKICNRNKLTFASKSNFTCF